MNRLAICLIVLTVSFVLSTNASAMYDPGLGRFCSRDPIAYEDSYSLFLFVRSKPTIYLDPDGLLGGPAPPAYCNGQLYNPMTHGCCDGKTLYALTIRTPKPGQTRGGTSINQCCKKDGTGTVFDCSTLPTTTVLNYGNYCGPSRTVPTSACSNGGLIATLTPKPIDAMDQACAQHDCCLATIDRWANPCFHIPCNVAFCQSLRAMNCSASPNPNCESYRQRALALTCVTQFGLLPLP